MPDSADYPPSVLHKLQEAAKLLDDACDELAGNPKQYKPVMKVWSELDRLLEYGHGG